MIVRIATEGQYRIDSAILDELNAIDAELVGSIGAEDRARFHDLLHQLVTLVRDHGTLVPPDELVESDLIVPPPDTTLAEAAHLFADQGLIPGYEEPPAEEHGTPPRNGFRGGVRCCRVVGRS